MAINDLKDTELSDQENMDQNENTSINKSEANADESHQAQQTIHLHKTPDAGVNMVDDREQESENDSSVTDAGEEEPEEKKRTDEEVKIVAEVPGREPVQPTSDGLFFGEDMRVREVKTEIHLGEMPTRLSAYL